MPIEFLCPGCNRRLVVAEGSAGKQAVCPECGTAVVIPSVAPSAPQRAAADSGIGAATRPGPGSGEAAYHEPARHPPPYSAYRPGAIGRDVPTYLVQAILVTIFCCLPFGIVAIVFAAQVNAKLAAGDFDGALYYSDNARTWCWVSFWLALVPTVLYLIVMAVGGLHVLH